MDRLIDIFERWDGLGQFSFLLVLVVTGAVAALCLVDSLLGTLVTLVRGHPPAKRSDSPDPPEGGQV